jgi:DNA polymerase III subunit gamma/tau
MAYKALYRTYRPQYFNEIAGQQVIVKTIQNALQLHKLSHAYLFAGPRGTGKTTMAKIFSKGLNCQKQQAEPCGECDNCLALQENRHPDVIEIDAASNNGVDEVRDLIDKVKYAPIKGQYKIYIIDEVHMMTSGAFNALLKTLEEPPSHVVFILATTEPHKILPTILSRCQRFDFGKVQEKDLLQRLKLILEQEHIQYDEQAIQLVAKLADGGVRDALSIIDQVIAYTGGDFRQPDVLKLFGLASMADKFALLTAVGEKNITVIVEKIDHLTALGADFKALLMDLLIILKDVLILVKTQNPSLMTLIRETEANKLLESLSLDLINQLIELLMSLQGDYRQTQALPALIQLRLMTLASGPAVPVKSPTIFEVMKPPIKSNVTPGQSTPSSPELASIGESLFIDDVNIIKVMVAGDKDQKLDMVAAWKRLDDLKFQSNHAAIVLALKDTRPYVLSKHILILEADTPQQAQKLNLLPNQPLIQATVQTISSFKGLVYTVNRQESVKLKKLFMDLAQLNKLPAKLDTPPTVKNWTFAA